MKGTVIKRGKKWAVVIDVGRDADGRRVRKWHSGFPTKREAETARVEILGRLQHGDYVAPTKITVSESFADWLEGRVGLAETTLEGYERDARRITARISHVGWATLALSAGVAPKVVQERLGHSSIAITMDRYSHVIEGMDRAAAETVAALIEHTSG